MSGGSGHRCRHRDARRLRRRIHEQSLDEGVGRQVVRQRGEVRRLQLGDGEVHHRREQRGRPSVEQRPARRRVLGRRERRATNQRDAGRVERGLHREGARVRTRDDDQGLLLEELIGARRQAGRGVVGRARLELDRSTTDATELVVDVLDRRLGTVDQLRCGEARVVGRGVDADDDRLTRRLLACGCRRRTALRWSPHPRRSWPLPRSWSQGRCCPSRRRTRRGPSGRQPRRRNRSVVARVPASSLAPMRSPRGTYDWFEYRITGLECRILGHCRGARQDVRRPRRSPQRGCRATGAPARVAGDPSHIPWPPRTTERPSMPRRSAARCPRRRR